MAPSLRRSAARSTLTSHLGIPHGDRSFLLVRERLGKSAAGECLALHGAFDQSVQERLHQTLLGLTHSMAESSLPLVLDLCGVSALDEWVLARLLKVQREMSPRPVAFQIAEDGPVLPLIRRLGLEERFGLEPVKRPVLIRTAVPAFPVSRADADKVINRTLLQASLTAE